MITFTLDLVPIWTFILGVGVLFYVLLDGFDLGVGILFGFAHDTASRNLIMNSIAPVWDGSETWLSLGGVGLFAAFPLAFAIIIPAVYFPVLIMLLARNYPPPIRARTQAVTTPRMVWNRFAPALRLAVSMTVRISASPWAAHMAR